METSHGDLSRASVPDLLSNYAAILQELRDRGVVRTRNAPPGDYAERVPARVYAGELAANSVEANDLVAADGRHVQVKARTVSPDTGAGAIFSVFRSFDFDVAVLVTFDSATYALRWAREVTSADIETAGRHSAHVNGHRIAITAGARLGVDVTSRFRASCRNSRGRRAAELRHVGLCVVGHLPVPLPGSLTAGTATDSGSGWLARLAAASARTRVRR